jgi:1-acyl-sn-glycerol-3-phosphate acyltransferase
MSARYHVPLQYRISRPVMRWVCRLLFHILGRVYLSGVERVPYGKAYIVIINHISIFDPPLAAAFWPEVLEIMGASDVALRPGQGQVFKLYGVIPVHRGVYDRQAMRHAIAALDSGRPLLMAPEGGRSHAPTMRRAKPGIAYLIEKADVPVIPAGLIGTTDDFWQRAKRGERPHLEMRIGKPFSLPPISGAGLSKREARQRNADLAMSHVAALLPEKYRGVYAETAIPSSETIH